MLNRNSLRSLSVRLVPLMAVMSATTCWALVGGVIVGPTPVILGFQYYLSPDERNNTDGVDGYQWELERIYPTCTIPKTVIFNEQNLTQRAEVPVENNYTLKVTYLPHPSPPGIPPQPPPGPTYHPKQIVIAKATKAFLVSGLNTPIPNNGSITLKYHPAVGSTLCGPLLLGTAQERITNTTNFAGDVIADDPVFHPNAPSGTFRLFEGKIEDEHASWNGPDAWNAMPVPSTIASFTQHLRIMYSDSCGNLLEMPLGQINIRHQKISSTHWQVEVF